MHLKAENSSLKDRNHKLMQNNPLVFLTIFGKRVARLSATSPARTLKLFPEVSELLASCLEREISKL